MTPKWYWTLVSTTLLFTIASISYIYLSFRYGEGPQIEILSLLVTAYGVGSALRKVSGTNGSNGNNDC